MVPAGGVHIAALVPHGATEAQTRTEAVRRAACTAGRLASAGEAVRMSHQAVRVAHDASSCTEERSQPRAPVLVTARPSPYVSRIRRLKPLSHESRGRSTGGDGREP